MNVLPNDHGYECRKFEKPLISVSRVRFVSRPPDVWARPWREDSHEIPGTRPHDQLMDTSLIKSFMVWEMENLSHMGGLEHNFWNGIFFLGIYFYDLNGVNIIIQIQRETFPIRVSQFCSHQAFGQGTIW